MQMGFTVTANLQQHRENGIKGKMIIMIIT